MAHIARFSKRANEEQLPEQDFILKLNNKIFIFIVILAATILVVDYVLVMNFIDIIKEL